MTQTQADPDSSHNGAPGETNSFAGSFECPRCASAIESDFYGPCDECRQILRATVRADAREVESGAYEPKMNVTPNAVASKD